MVLDRGARPQVRGASAERVVPFPARRPHVRVGRAEDERAREERPDLRGQQVERHRRGPRAEPRIARVGEQALPGQLVAARLLTGTVPHPVERVHALHDELEDVHREREQVRAGAPRRGRDVDVEQLGCGELRPPDPAQERRSVARVRHLHRVAVHQGHPGVAAHQDVALVEVAHHVVAAVQDVGGQRQVRGGPHQVAPREAADPARGGGVRVPPVRRVGEDVQLDDLGEPQPGHDVPDEPVPVEHHVGRPGEHRVAGGLPPARGPVGDHRAQALLQVRRAGELGLVEALQHPLRRVEHHMDRALSAP